MIVVKSVLMAQNDFVSIKDSKFFCRNKEFRFLGFNAYYLQNEAAKGNSYIVDEVFRMANKYSVKVIRTWAFNDADGITSPSVMRYAPNEYNESALQALDYVLMKAKEYDIKLILTLANSNPDFGGIKQYIDWSNRYMLPKSKGTKYEFRDFFTDGALKQWYKDYIYLILNRTNTFTQEKYRDDTSIFCLEMINEAESLYDDFNVLLNWYDEMSTYIRKIDANHLIATGEAGYDLMDHLYSDADFSYNSSYFLLDGCKGTSYYSNSNLVNVDLASYHLYPDGWQISPSSGVTWIRDHEGIAEKLKKPSLLGEFGIRNNKSSVYKEWLSSISKTRNKSALAWQYLHPDIADSHNDGYGFNELNPDILELIQQYNEELAKEIPANVIYPETAILFQNYPNPFNPVTTVRYALAKEEDISLDLYNIMGEKIVNIDKGSKQKGEHQVTISLDENSLPSGAYFYSLKTSAGVITKKLLLLK